MKLNHSTRSPTGREAVNDENRRPILNQLLPRFHLVHRLLTFRHASPHRQRQIQRIPHRHRSS